MPALRAAMWKEDRRPEGRGIVARSAMPRMAGRALPSCPVRLAPRTGRPVATEPQWPRIDTRHMWILRRDARLWHPVAALRLLAIEPAIPRRRSLLSGAIDAPRLPKNPHATGMTVGDLRFRGRSLGTRHAPVTRQSLRQPLRFQGLPPSSLPRCAASDDGGFARGDPPARRLPGMRSADPMPLRAVGSASPAPRGPQAPPPAAPPLAARAAEGSLRRGGQGLGTLGTAGFDDLHHGIRHPVRHRRSRRAGG